MFIARNREMSLTQVLFPAKQISLKIMMMTDDNEWLMKKMTLGDGDGDGWTMMDDGGLWWMMLDEDGWRWMRMMMIMIFESLKIKETHQFPYSTEILFSPMRPMRCLSLCPFDHPSCWFQVWIVPESVSVPLISNSTEQKRLKLKHFNFDLNEHRKTNELKKEMSCHATCAT